jgi:putative SOS response-associated peptidase YedK
MRPRLIQPVIYMRDGIREIGEMRWGFKFADRLAFNARADKLTASPSWKERLSRRCIVPASSMFEWEKNAPVPKPKYRLTVKRRPIFGMAGIWSPWNNPKTGQWEDTFAIITDDPNTKMSAIHDRQAIVLEPNEYAEWLAESERPSLTFHPDAVYPNLLIDRYLPVRHIPPIRAFLTGGLIYFTKTVRGLYGG